MSMTDKWKLVSREHGGSGDNVYVKRETHELTLADKKGILFRETFYPYHENESTAIAMTFMPGDWRN